MKNKGFTLVELLAVIVILAVISLIATPMILNVIETSKKGAAEASVNGYLDGLEKYMITSSLEAGSSLKENVKYYLTKETTVDGETISAINDLVDVKGNKPTGLEDYIILDNKGTVIEGKMTINGYNIEITNNKVTTIVKGEVIAVTGITIEGEAEVVVGSTINLTATISPNNASNKSVTWESSDTTKATVTNGVVTGVAPGTVTITAKGANNKEATKTITVKALYKETILNGADPVITGDLIPVTISDAGVVTYADITTKWYEYGNGSKKWANAVILVDSPSKKYSVGNTISESDIESYFVWIPKYSYKIWDLGNYSSQTGSTTKNQPIDIRFGTNNTSDANSGECTTPQTSGNIGNCGVNEYMTHPAFITLGVNGIWVGKFETGYKGATSTSEAEVNSADATKIIVKPNVYSWRSISVSNIYNTSLEYNDNLKSHMMKNTEWGAVAYLSHSAYGINTEITINNCSSLVTGIGADTVSASSSSSTCTNATNKWTGTKGKLATTTGNITGVYDMSGGANEYMASNRNSKAECSEFVQMPTGIFIDIYNISFDSSLNYTGRILGDATGEMGPFGTNYIGSWYDDEAAFVNQFSWFIRGGSYDMTTKAGVFSFTRNAGGYYKYFGFRLVLAP